MHRLPMNLMAAAWLIVFSTGAFAQAKQPTTVAAQGRAATSPSQVQVDLLRGLADIFSRGMDTLTEKLNRQGYSAPESTARMAGSRLPIALPTIIHAVTRILL